MTQRLLMFNVRLLRYRQLSNLEVKNFKIISDKIITILTQLALLNTQIEKEEGVSIHSQKISNSNVHTKIKFITSKSDTK
jgi:hypothetical protein